MVCAIGVLIMIKVIQHFILVLMEQKSVQELLIKIDLKMMKMRFCLRQLVYGYDDENIFRVLL